MSTERSNTLPTLVIADWTIDAHKAFAALAGGDAEHHFEFVVPAWLHGLDCIGDPYAMVPCAHRQAEALADAATTGGVPVDLIEVGDPDPVAAATDLLAQHPAGDILVLVRDRGWRAAHPLDLAHRLKRLTGLEVRTRRVAALAA